MVDDDVSDSRDPPFVGNGRNRCLDALIPVFVEYWGGKGDTHVG